MQKQHNNLLVLTLLILSVLGGCKKKQTSNSNSIFSKEKKSKHQKNKSVIDPLQLDSESMKTFSLDDTLSKHTSTIPSSNNNSIFSWENVEAEQSKNQFKQLYFDFNKDTLKSKQEKVLQENINEAKKMIKQGKTIVIEGHACHSAGSAAYNLAISERRARHVAQKFASKGIDSANIKIAPRGQEMPVKKGGNRKEQAINRRVEIYAIDNVANQNQ